MKELSDYDALVLLEDRVKFKLYAAEQELTYLKNSDKRGSSISSSTAARVTWEMKIECLLANLVGSVDALLIRINDKLGLGMKIKDVNSGPPSVSEIKKRLNTHVGGKSNLLDPLDLALDPGDYTTNPPKDPGYLWTLRDLRNQGMHRNLINIHVHVSLHEDLNTDRSWSDRNRVFLKTDPQVNLEIIPYLEDSLLKTTNLVETIIASEPLLKI
jgi:hypothetical protein